MFLLQSGDNREKKPVRVGPWGGQGGFGWDDGVYSGVKQLVIAHGSGIDSLQIEYDKKGASIWSERHGGSGGNKTDKVKLDYPNEFLTSVHGHYGSLYEWGPVMVRSLTLETNKRRFGPFGNEQGTYFSIPTAGGKIVGLHGRSDWYVDAIGIHLKPAKQELKAPSKPLVQANNYVNGGTDKAGYSVLQGSGDGSNYDIVVAVRHKNDHSKVSHPQQSPLPLEANNASGSLDKVVKPEGKPSKTEVPASKTDGVLRYGPWGGHNGTAFDDGTYTGIRQIYVSRNVGIVYLRAQYDRDGEPVWGSRHGGTGGFKTDKIMFDYPQEILTHITGTYGPLMYMGPNIIKSLTFYTNKGKHGPFGDEQGPSFTSKIDEGRIVGFHGREGFFLDGLGVHVLEGIVKPPKSTFSDAIVKAGGDHHVAEIDNYPCSRRGILWSVEGACSSRTRSMGRRWRKALGRWSFLRGETDICHKDCRCHLFHTDRI
ncbi:unnamed protein product [Linum tenue]|uniref:Jacalin-type lectin domain-containing protein n=1 Tax=Linum tenue TaxID=586396 RepID=A0AAV0LPL1_9ROSI|nr:unnamed protein product [Linum tenue]